jgi:hypothetical protein
VDPGEHVDNGADTDPIGVLRQKSGEARRSGLAAPDYGELADLYLCAPPVGEAPWGLFEEESLLRALVKYGRAISHTTTMYRHLAGLREQFDFEVSVDETDSPTTPLEHFFIASELTRAGVRFTSLAPRFTGRFEKGVDYIGDLTALDGELARHAAVTRHFGSYKLSLHSGSDKFSLYPLMVRHWGPRLHVKTAGTSYLEALRALAQTEPALFRDILALALSVAGRSRAHVSPKPASRPARCRAAGLLEDFHARQVLHVTWPASAGRPELKAALVRHAATYDTNLKRGRPGVAAVNRESS